MMLLAFVLILVVVAVALVPIAFLYLAALRDEARPEKEQP